MFFSKLWHDGRGGLIGRPSQKFLISKFCITGILMHVIVHIIKINHKFLRGLHWSVSLMQKALMVWVPVLIPPRGTLERPSKQRPWPDVKKSYTIWSKSCLKSSHSRFYPKKPKKLPNIFASFVKKIVQEWPNQAVIVAQLVDRSLLTPKVRG